MPSDASFTLLFDGDCRVCSAFARVARRLDVRRTLRIRPIQESERWLLALPPDERLGAAHVVAPDGRLTSGADAMPALVAAMVAGPEFEQRLRASRRSMSALTLIYRIMTEVRGQLTCATGGPSWPGHTPR